MGANRRNGVATVLYFVALFAVVAAVITAGSALSMTASYQLPARQTYWTLTAIAVGTAMLGLIFGAIIDLLHRSLRTLEETRDLLRKASGIEP